MRSESESQRWLKDANACLNGAQKSMKVNDFRTVVQNGQLAVELSCKAIIACFGEPAWTHDPSDQLLEITNFHQNEIKRYLGSGILEDLNQMAGNVTKVAPWHGWSVYGRKSKKGWIAAVDLCTPDKAAWVLQLAEKCFHLAEEFVRLWFQKE